MSVLLTAEQAQQIEEALDTAYGLAESGWAEHKYATALATIRAARAQEQAEQEPMFFGLTQDHTWLSISEGQYEKVAPEGRMKVYTATPQRQWVEPSDAKLRDMHHIEEFGLFCDYDEFEQIARAVLKLAKELNNR